MNLKNCDRKTQGREIYVDFACGIYVDSAFTRRIETRPQAAKLVTEAYNLSSKQKLDRDLGWETIQCRADILGLNIFHKIHVKETRPLIRNCMPKLDRDKELNLRSKITYQPFKTKSEIF